MQPRFLFAAQAKFFFKVIDLTIKVVINTLSFFLWLVFFMLYRNTSCFLRSIKLVLMRDCKRMKPRVPQKKAFLVICHISGVRANAETFSAWIDFLEPFYCLIRLFVRAESTNFLLHNFFSC